MASRRRSARASRPGDGGVTLGLFEPGDAAVLVEADGDGEHRRWFEFPDDFVPSLRHSESVLRRWDEERAAGTRFAFAVRGAIDRELLGGCELRPVGEKTANLSYWTAPRHRRRGVASRAVALACDIASADLGFHVVRIVADPDNVASRRVALRNGFKEAGEQDGKTLHVLELRSSTRMSTKGRPRR